MYQIPEIYYLHDYRGVNHFKKATFSGYQKGDVLKALEISIYEGKIEESCHWGLELLISGHIEELWEKLIILNSKLINLGNPKLSSFLWSRYADAFQLYSPEQENDPTLRLNLRNNQETRNRLVEIITIMTLSIKNKLPNHVRIKTDDFKIESFKNHLSMSVNDTKLINKIIIDDDPNEIKLVINEIANLIHFDINTDTYNIKDIEIKTKKIIYWLSWIFEWENLNIKKYNDFPCGLRQRKYVKPQFYKNIVWLIWDVIIQETSFRGSDQMIQQIYGLFKMFRYNFNLSSKKRKIPLIIQSLLMLIYDVKWSIPLIQSHNKKLVIQAMANVNFLFTEYKQNEQVKIMPEDLHYKILTKNDFLISSNSQILDQENNKKQKDNEYFSKNKQHINLNNINDRQSLIEEAERLALERRENQGLNTDKFEKYVDYKKTLNYKDTITKEPLPNYLNPDVHLSTKNMITQIQNMIEKKV